MTGEELLAAITSHYLESGDFNGYPLRDAAMKRSELAPTVKSLLERELISLSLGSAHPNPYIKAFPPPPVADQIGQLETTKDLAHVTAYPEKAHLAAVVNRGDYTGRPFTLRLMLGAGQLEPAFFDLSVLE